MSASTPAARKRIARAGAYAMHAKHPRAWENGLAAMTAGIDRVLIERYGIDPTQPDFQTRLEHARKSWRDVVSQAGVRARQEKRGQK